MAFRLFTGVSSQCFSFKSVQREEMIHELNEYASNLGDQASGSGEPRFDYSDTDAGVL